MFLFGLLKFVYLLISGLLGTALCCVLNVLERYLMMAGLKLVGL